VVRGPRVAEALARELLSHKLDVFAALEHRQDDTCHFCGGAVDRSGAGWGAWSDGRTMFGATVHVRCFNVMFPNGPRGDSPADDDIEREAIQAEGCGRLG
jgi:hypothetical protein